MCFLPIHSGHQVRWTYQPGSRWRKGHTGFLIHLLSVVRALIFLARNIQQFLSLVDREVVSDESFPNGGARGAFAKPSRSLREASKRDPRSLRGASKAPPRTLRGGLRTLRGGCTYRRLHEDALEGSRGLGYTILRATILIYNIGT